MRTWKQQIREQGDRSTVIFEDLERVVAARCPVGVSMLTDFHHKLSQALGQEHEYPSELLVELRYDLEAVYAWLTFEGIQVRGEPPLLYLFDKDREIGPFMSRVSAMFALPSLRPDLFKD